MRPVAFLRVFMHVVNIWNAKTSAIHKIDTHPAQNTYIHKTDFNKVKNKKKHRSAWVMDSWKIRSSNSRINRRFMTIFCLAQENRLSVPIYEYLRPTIFFSFLSWSVHSIPIVNVCMLVGNVVEANEEKKNNNNNSNPKEPKTHHTRKYKAEQTKSRKKAHKMLRH